MSASGVSFLGQVTRSNSVDFGYSNIAMHWLSKAPCNISGPGMYVPDAGEKTRKLFANFAAAEWERNLKARARELKPGGKLLIAHLTPGKTDDNREQECGRWAWRAANNLFYEVCKENRDEYGFSQELLDALTILCYFRTKDELLGAKSILCDNKEKVHGAGGKLLVDKMTDIHVPCPHFQKYQQNGNLDEFAENVTNSCLGISENMWCREITKHCTNLDFNEFKNDILKKWQTKIKTDPEYYKLDMFFTLFLATKLPEPKFEASG